MPKLRHLVEALAAILSLLAVLIWVLTPSKAWAFLDKDSSFGACSLLIGVTLSINVLFGALLTFGKLTGETIRATAHRKILFFLPPLAETPNFDSVSFRNAIEQLERWARGIVQRINRIMLWPTIAAIVAIIVLAFAAVFDADHHLKNSILFWLFVALSLPVPAGCLLHVMVHVVSRLGMRRRAAEARVLYKYANPPNPKRVAAVTDALRRQLRRGLNDD